MARPTTLNPLAIAFGGALRILRKGKSTNETASAAGLSPTFLRLIESGRNHIAIGKAVLLRGAFDKPINYEALVFFISTIAALEDVAADISDRKVRGARLSEQAALIASAFDRDHAFRIFLTKFLAPLNTFPLEVPSTLPPFSNILSAVQLEPDELRHLIAAAHLDQEAADLLIAFQSYGAGTHQIHQAYPDQFFSNVPTLYKEFFDGLKGSVLAFPRFFAPEVSWEWERKNYGIFEELFVVCSWKQLVHIENLTRYKFDYLWERHFKRAVFVLLDAPPEIRPTKYNEEFWNNLVAALTRRANDPERTRDDRQHAHQLLSAHSNSRSTLQTKTLFRVCSDDDKRRRLERLLSERKHENTSMNAIWFFRTTDKAFIGAASHIDPRTVKATHIAFLTFSECSNSLAILNDLFPGLL